MQESEAQQAGGGSSGDPGGQRWRGELVVALAALAVAWPVFGYGYVLHDDPLEILGNPAFQPFDRAGFVRVWTEPDFSRVYMPVYYTALGVLTSLSRWWQGDPGTLPAAAAIHGAGVVLHALNAVLVLRILRRVRIPGREAGGTRWPAVAGAMVFALHPVQVESYARAGNLTVTLGAFLALLATLLWLRHGERGEPRWALGATLCFALALLTRPPAATFGRRGGCGFG